MVWGVSLAASGCGGGGGGGGGTTLTIVNAAFVGAGTTPVPGEKLVLLLSGDASLMPGAILDDTDLTLLTLSSGTLGFVTAPPTLVGTRSVEITLGPGVSFTPGVTTIAFADGNDAVADTSGRLARAGGAPVTVTKGDGDAPSVTRLTLDDIAPALSGVGPAGGTLQVPRNGFTIDVYWSDPTSAIDGAATVLTANVDVSVPGGTRSAGASLTSALALSSNGQRLTFSVPATVSFPEGPVTLTAIVVDATGMTSAPASFSFRVKALTDALRPFETTVNATQVWFLDTSRDIESYTHDPGNAAFPLRVNASPNGRADLEDLFFVVGLFGSNATINTTVMDRFRSLVLQKLDAIYGGAKVTFTFTSPGSFPPGRTTVPYNSFSFSQICIAGAEDPAGTTGVLGLAIFDPNNANHENDCLTDFQGSQRLGVFLHTMINAGLRPPSSTLFRTTYDPLTPASGGKPIGDDAGDAQRLAGTLNDARRTTIDNAIARMANAAAVVVAHECGHSVGLVKDGAMPAGLYGGDAVNFPGSTTGHIRNTDGFTAPAQNVMSPSVSFEATNDSGTRFNDLNLAYLLETVLYDT